jgi:tRNA A-37 threonylcarbamoyl transferase component Bud32
VLPQVRDQLLGPDGLRLCQWLQMGQARVIKHGPHRSVYAVTLPDLSFYVKHNRIANTRAWLRELARPSKARAECQRALDVASRRVPTVTPLAVGEQTSALGRGESFLVTASLDHTMPLDTFVESILPTLEPGRRPGIRQRLAVALGMFLARMHGEGILHRDLHAGNVMLRLSAQDEPALFLLDLHSVRLGNALGWKASRDNLVVFNRWFILHAGRTDRLRFWHAYHQARAEVCDWPRSAGGDARQTVLELARDLEKRTRRSNFRFWRRRDRRCLGENRYYRRVAAAGVVGHAVTELDGELRASLLADPDEPFRRPGMAFLKDSRTSTVVEFDLTLGGTTRRVIYKRFCIKSRKGPWLSLVRRPPALRSWLYGHGLRERCLPTARPLLVLHRRSAGALWQGYLLSLKIQNGVELPRFLDDSLSLAPLERARLLRDRVEQVARLIRELHRRGVSNRDLKGANILTRAISGPTAHADRLHVDARANPSTPDVCVIDLVGVAIPRRLGRQRQVQNLARLAASVGRHAALRRTDLLRFLRVYLQWGLFGHSAWKDWWREIKYATHAKIARNARLGRPLD